MVAALLHLIGFELLQQRFASSSAEAGTIWEDIDVRLPTHCSGCGIELQQEDPNAPGFFQVPKRLLEQLQEAEVEEDDLLEAEGTEAAEEQRQGASSAAAGGKDPAAEEEKWQQFDDLVESWGGQPQRAEVRAYSEGPEEDLHVLCARCYSLRHYGQVKSTDAEAALPAFDFTRRVGRKIALQKFRRSIVLMVVDVADFDGSLPRQAIRSLLQPEQLEGDPAKAFPRNFRLVVAVNKADLLPNQVTQQRLESWVRKRCSQGGLPRPSAVHVLSSTKRWGVRELLSDLQRAAGSRGDVWVVGAQNAGKSSLINAMRGVAGLGKERNVTAAPLPGTTLGMVTVPGLLPPGSKMLDTPGVPHAFQLASLLTADEMRMVLPKRQLRPRTYRIAAGQTVMVGALARVDVLSCPGATLYLTLWASDEVGCHFGKTEGADERYAKHAGTKLVPPLGGVERMEAFPPLQPTDVVVQGDSWRESSRDVAIAGLGWIAVGVKGEANLRVWAPKGVAITMHDALVPDYARDLERPGFGSLLPGKQLAGVAGSNSSSSSRPGGSSGGGSKKGKR
ncbi:hypothetical protein N2152v2_007212 [Parachlorella kessleri]